MSKLEENASESLVSDGIALWVILDVNCFSKEKSRLGDIAYRCFVCLPFKK